MIDLEHETLVSLDEARQWFPKRRGGKVVAFSTIWRWAKVGYHGILLDAVRVGSTLCTSKVAVHRFLEAMTQADNPLAVAQARPRKTRREVGFWERS